MVSEEMVKLCCKIMLSETEISSTSRRELKLKKTLIKQKRGQNLTFIITLFFSLFNEDNVILSIYNIEH